MDENLNPISDTELQVEVDAVLLSAGLILDNIITEEVNIIMDTQTKRQRIDQNY